MRKSELQGALWDEVDFENAVWTIPKERMKRSKAHNVYLSRQALDIMIALKTCAGNSRRLLGAGAETALEAEGLVHVGQNEADATKRRDLGFG